MRLHKLESEKCSVFCWFLICLIECSFLPLRLFLIFYYDSFNNGSNSWYSLKPTGGFISSGMLRSVLKVSVCQSAWHNIPADLHLHQYHRENVRSRTNQYLSSLTLFVNHCCEQLVGLPEHVKLSVLSCLLDLFRILI